MSELQPTNINAFRGDLAEAERNLQSSTDRVAVLKEQIKVLEAGDKVSKPTPEPVIPDKEPSVVPGPKMPRKIKVKEVPEKAIFNLHKNEKFGVAQKDVK